MQMHKEKTDTLTVRLPLSLIAKVKQMAHDQQRTVSNMGAVLLTDKLKNPER